MSLKEFRKIVRKNIFFNVRISSNRYHSAGPSMNAAHKSIHKRRGADNDNQKRNVDPSIDYPLPPASTKRGSNFREAVRLIGVSLCPHRSAG